MPYAKNAIYTIRKGSRVLQFRTSDAPEMRQCQTKSFLGNLVCFKFKTCNHDLRNSLKSTVDNPNFRLRRCLEGDPWYLGFLGAVRSLSRAKINTRTRHSARCSTVLIFGTSRMGSKTCHLYSTCRSLHRFRTLNAAHSQQLCSACGPHVPINKMS